MNATDRTVRVFISSTFKDMHAERDHLVTQVFPELRERCERLGLEFVDVDLRWGVPEKTLNEDQMEQANSWEYCRKRIDQVQPFFLCMLGHRYGWVPEPEQLKTDTDKEAQAADARSITHMEVHHAVLNTSLKHRTYFYLRSTEAPPTATDFIETDSRWITKLESLKTAIGLCDRPVRNYHPKWQNDHFIELEEFGKVVLEDLWSGVLRDERYVSKEAWQRVLDHAPDADPLYTDDTKTLPKELWDRLVTEAKPEPKTPLEAEREGMERFAESRLKFFQGRTHELNELLQFIRDPAPESRLALLAAQPGQGKSALMAKLWQELQVRALAPASAASDSRRVEDNAPYLIAHFVGATANSSSSYHLVRRINDELDASGIGFPEPETNEEPKLDFQSLCQRLWTRLGDYDGERRIVILLDALNQLDDGHDLAWLPYRLGPNVRVVVSCIEETPTDSENPQIKNQSAGSLNLRESPLSESPTPADKVLTALHARHPKPRRIALRQLTPEDVQEIVTRYLDEYGKQLDAEHVATICDEQKLPQARNPLYLLVMLAELRTLGGNDMNQRVPELIARMSADHPDTVSLFHWMLERLEHVEGFGQEPVRWWCLYLALGRVGMSSRELSDLLKRKFGDEAAATAQRIERALRRYLLRRGEQWDFFHGQLRQAVMERCGGEQQNVVQGHHDIADSFRALADPAGDRTWISENHRAFSEAAPHLIGAELWDDLCAYLTDFRCLDRRVQAGQIFGVLNDQQAAIAGLPELAGKAQLERMRAESCKQYGEALVAYARDRAKGKASPIPHPPPYSAAAEVDARPRKTTTRSDQLRAIATFVQRQASLIVEFPDDFLAMAANATHGPPLSGAAQIADEVGHPWLHRNPRPSIPYSNPLCLVNLEGHTDFVNSVALTTDGFRAISGSSDRTLRIWDLANGRCIAICEGHTDSVNSVALSADGFRAISGSDDRTLRVWNLSSGLCIFTLSGHTDSVNSVALSADGFRAISGSNDKTLRVWDLNSGLCVGTLAGHDGSVNSVALSADGFRAVSGSRDKTLRVWDLVEGQCVAIHQGHTDSVNSVALSADGLHALSICQNRMCAWDLKVGLCLDTIGNRFCCAALSPDGGKAFSCVGNHLVINYLLTGNRQIVLQNLTKAYLGTLAISPDCSRVLAGCSDGKLHLWSLAGGACRLNGDRPKHSERITCVALARDGSVAVTGSRSNELSIWHKSGGLCIASLSDRVFNNVVLTVAISRDGTRILSGSSDRTARVWDHASKECIAILRDHTDQVHSVAFSPDGSRALSGCRDGTLRLWDLGKGECLITLKGHTCSIRGVAFLNDGSRAISGSIDGTLRLWNLENGACLTRYQCHHGFNLDCLAVSFDGSRAVSGGWQTLRVLDLHLDQCLRELRGHKGTVEMFDPSAFGYYGTRASITDDGSRAVTCADDRALRVWDVERGDCLAVYHAGSGIEDVAISPTGGCIVCATQDGQMHFLTPRNFPPLA